MRVLLILPDLASDITNYTGIASYGVASLRAVLLENGHDVHLIHWTQTPKESELRARLQVVRPDLIGFSVNSHYAHRLPVWAKWARAHSSARIIVGGIHATLAPQEIMAIPQVDFVCVNEGERTLVELCDVLERGKNVVDVAGLWVREKDQARRTKPRPLATDLDKLPIPDFGGFDFENLYPVRRGYFPYLMSRGCGYSCSYCCVHTLRKSSGATSSYWRFLSPARAVDQLRILLDRHPVAVDRIQFLDTILFPDREWLTEFSRLYRDRIDLPFSCNMRADLVDDDVARQLAEMKCEVVRFGVESGDEEMTRHILTRGLKIDDIRQAFATLRRFGVHRWSYNMVGLPEETLARALSTVKLNAEMMPELSIPFLFYPYPGTRLHQHCHDRGYLTDREFDHYFAGVVVSLPDFPEGDILFVHRFFVQLVRLYGVGRSWPRPRRDRYWKALDTVLQSPLMPRTAMVHLRDSYKRLRHRLGESLVRRSPAVYRLLGGTDPV
jgi:radical SAM superfamily enzyme YgiQ (UPF0313 family)